MSSGITDFEEITGEEKKKKFSSNNPRNGSILGVLSAPREWFAWGKRTQRRTGGCDASPSGVIR